MTCASTGNIGLLKGLGPYPMLIFDENDGGRMERQISCVNNVGMPTIECRLCRASSDFRYVKRSAIKRGCN